MNQAPCILFWDINSAHSAKLSSPVLYLTVSKGIKTIFSLFHMNFVDFIAHKSNRLLTCTIQVTHINLQMHLCCAWKPPLVFQLWTSVEKRLPAVLSCAACFLDGLVSTIDLVDTIKLISRVAKIKFQGRPLELKSQGINALYMLPPCYISVAVSQLNYHLYGMEEGHRVLPGGKWNMIFFFYYAKLFQSWSHNVTIL